MADLAPILVIGAPRSGTTWVGRTVSQSPGVRYVHEPFNCDYPNREFGVKVERWMYDAEGGAQRGDIDCAYARLLCQSVLRRAFRDGSSPLNWKTPVRMLKHLGRHLLSTERILVKDPLATLSADWLHERFGFQVVCVIRSPLSFVASMKQSGWGFDPTELALQPSLMRRKLASMAPHIVAAGERRGDLVDQAILLWNVVHTCILDYQERYASWLYVKQEQLALDPEEGFRPVFQFLDLPFGDEIRGYLARYTSAPDHDRHPSAKYRPRDARATLDAWRSILTKDEIARVNENTGGLVARFYPHALA